MSAQDAKERAYDARVYQVGLVLALVLSAVPFGAVALGLLPASGLLWTIAICAIVQILVHFRCFLHIDLSSNHRHDLQLILFSVCIVILMAGGTLWVIGNQRAMMM